MVFLIWQHSSVADMDHSNGAKKEPRCTAGGTGAGTGTGTVTGRRLFVLPWRQPDIDASKVARRAATTNTEWGKRLAAARLDAARARASRSRTGSLERRDAQRFGAKPMAAVAEAVAVAPAVLPAATAGPVACRECPRATRQKYLLKLGIIEPQRGQHHHDTTRSARRRSGTFTQSAESEVLIRCMRGQCCNRRLRRRRHGCAGQCRVALRVAGDTHHA